MRWSAFSFVLLLAIGSGCAVVDWIFGPEVSYQRTFYGNTNQTHFMYPARRRGDESPWIGHQADELVAALGRPDSILEARPKGAEFRDGIHVLSYIYYVERSSRGSCIDAYVVAEATGTIVDYYCR